MKIKEAANIIYPDTAVKIVVGYEPIMQTHARNLAELAAIAECEIKEIYLSAIDRNMLCLKIGHNHPETGMPIKEMDLVTGEIR